MEDRFATASVLSEMRPLQPAGNAKHRSGDYRLPEWFIDVAPDNGVDHIGFALKSSER